MTTTHKTLRGPRGAIILCKQELAEKIDKAVFPGIQGGPHENVIAGKAICLQEAAKPAFRTYAKQIIKNARILAGELKRMGITVCSGGTDTHLILIDLTNIGVTGKEAEQALEKAGIVVNKNMVPGDTRSPFDPSGIRLGVPAVTTRGMKELEMVKLAGLINRVVREPNSRVVLKSVKKEVSYLCGKFPVPK